MIDFSQRVATRYNINLLTEISRPCWNAVVEHPLAVIPRQSKRQLSNPALVIHRQQKAACRAGRRRWSESLLFSGNLTAQFCLLVMAQAFVFKLA
jgi:hypothetical protein